MSHEGLGLGSESEFGSDESVVKSLRFDDGSTTPPRSAAEPPTLGDGDWLHSGPASLDRRVSGQQSLGGGKGCRSGPGMDTLHHVTVLDDTSSNETRGKRKTRRGSPAKRTPPRGSRSRSGSHGSPGQAYSHTTRLNSPIASRHEQTSPK